MKNIQGVEVIEPAELEPFEGCTLADIDKQIKDYLAIEAGWTDARKEAERGNARLAEQQRARDNAIEVAVRQGKKAQEIFDDLGPSLLFMSNEFALVVSKAYLSALKLSLFGLKTSLVKHSAILEDWLRTKSEHPNPDKGIRLLEIIS